MTYSSSMMTYRVSLFAWSDSQDAISIPLQCPIVGSRSLRLAVSSQLSLTVEGVMSITRPGIFRACHICCMASSPRCFHVWGTERSVYGGVGEKMDDVL